ncbi:MAG: tRNA pseudouridine(38-40) synthase TruA [Fibrobacter sp.]|nr:tRNA pseudouridine(38-40) synthase TruA [Fibrobacter sp.]
MRYRFRCEYLGSAYYGWQEQNEHGKTKYVTVQSALEEAFKTALRTPIDLVAAGRTDTGVHARGQMVHFDYDGEIDCKKLTRSINGLGRHTVKIRDLEVCDPEFHSRYDAVSRYYVYSIFTRPVALLRDFGWEIGHLPIDYDLMQREAKSFIGEHDFIRFCIPRNDGKSTLCNITRFELIKVSDSMVQWHIQGNRFLHRQVRAMVGTLFDVGRGRYPEGTVNEIFADRFKGERTMAPPQALVLEDVIY